MVHLNDLPTDEQVREAGYKGVISKSAKRRIWEQLKQHRKQLLRDKCLRALKRRHWEAIANTLNSEYCPGCFTTYEPPKEGVLYLFQKGCNRNLFEQDVLCQACVITTKLMEVLDE